MHDGADFSLEIEPKSPATSKGRILVIAGRAMLMKDVAHEAGYEIDALDGPVLTHQLVMTSLDQAFPKGPGSVASGKPSFKIVQKKRAIRIATSSAGGRMKRHGHSLARLDRSRDESFTTCGSSSQRKTGRSRFHSLASGRTQRIGRHSTERCLSKAGRSIGLDR